ncbi:MAG: peptide chain release factor N(5)-glutamine methyltransferase [Proteobacteria bacterium]|nr:peptide chain release factor N(5)-glutamine methyltransferase [Pseudomonadota bacterium]
MQELPRLGDIVTQTTAVLAPLLGGEARREAETVVLTALGLSRSALFSTPERPLTATETARVADWATRRADGVPLAYLSGEREFWSLPLRVGPAVLVPRPETETLVAQALIKGDAWCRSTATPASTLDLGTGSGAIALAIAVERLDWPVTAVERSPAALAVARENALRLEVGRLEFLAGDWFAPLGTRRFAVVVSNPPYVAADDPVLHGDSLRHEPRTALTPGVDALADLHALIDAAPDHLLPGGWLLLEHGADQAAAVRERLAARGYADIVSHRDPAGHERVTEGRR